MSSHSRAAHLAVGAPRRDTHTHLPLAFPYPRSSRTSGDGTNAGELCIGRDVFRGDVAPLLGNINLSITSPPSPFNSCLCPGATCNTAARRWWCGKLCRQYPQQRAQRDRILVGGSLSVLLLRIVSGADDDVHRAEGGEGAKFVQEDRGAIGQYWDDEQYLHRGCREEFRDYTAGIHAQDMEKCRVYVGYNLVCLCAVPRCDSAS
ncbi:hypothetical protein B0H19DRAFT_1274785 [Mycena capillaripes]|nr:hypothetical protein B0H19DRAFT_1274785 [Mycena capillaripes]